MLVAMSATGSARIRAATPADAPAMSSLIRRTVSVSNTADYSPAVIEHLLEEFAPAKVAERMEGRDVFVLCVEESMVGTISLGLAAGKLHSMFVDPDRQKQGFGRQLVDHLEHHAASKGFQEIVVSSSLTARPFYEKLGYVSEAFEEKPGASTWFMRKQILHA